MDSKWLSTFIFHITFFLSIWSSYGAISSQKVDSNQDFLEAWKNACETSGGVFTVAEGTYLLSGSLLFQGPCNGETTVTIDGVLQASSEVTLPTDYWIGFDSVDDLTINGKGTLDGNGGAAWGSAQQRPTSLNFQKVSNVQIQDIKSVNSKMFHIKIYDSQHVTLNNVTISAPADSANTDGVHVSLSSDITITNSVIATGDDCISIGEGSSNVNITEVSCGPGHGLSIGSLGKNQGEQDVGSITVTNCTLTGTANGLRIKTFASSVSLVAHDLTFQHIIMDNVNNPIIIDQHYCDKHIGCGNGQGESDVQIIGVKFIDVTGSSATQVAVKLDCSGSKPCQDIQLSGVNLNFNNQPNFNSQPTATCSNADAKFLEADQVPSSCSGTAVTL